MYKKTHRNDEIRVPVGHGVSTSIIENEREQQGRAFFDLKVKIGKLWGNFGESSMTIQQKQEYDLGKTINVLNH